MTRISESPNFNLNKSQYSAVMFHHFHGKNHNESQGSIDANQFSEVIYYLRKNKNLLNADEYIWRLDKKILTDKDICLTFDDALLCQSDIALPILNSEKISAFFFIYSSPLIGKPDFLEIYRFFRNECFGSVDDFYLAFFEYLVNNYHDKYKKAQLEFEKINYLEGFSFYSFNDKWFRYLRDQLLGPELYSDVMGLLMEQYSFVYTEVLTKLWMSSSDVTALDRDGHIVGLHSHNHPTTIHKLTAEQQTNEYETNFDYLRSIIKKKPISMSHPCGNYNEATLNVLRKLGIQIGFRSSLSIPFAQSSLEIPRHDHVNVIAEMNK
jgi:peptidoglycan/xylan/chitin deacetylase (PgdA/CDA1 family)